MSIFELNTYSKMRRDNMNLKNIMTKDVSTVSPDTTINEAAQLMKELDVGSIPVCEGTKPVGILTDRDITIRNVAEGDNPTTPVKNVMTEDLVYGSPEMSVDEASKIMADNQIRRLPIVEEGNLIGIISLGDIAVDTTADVEIADALSSISVPSKPQK